MTPAASAYPDWAGPDGQIDWPDVAHPSEWSLPVEAPRLSNRRYALMRIVTTLGGATTTILAGVAMMAAGGTVRRAGLVALVANVISHLAVQVLKRVVARPRPCDPHGRPLALIDLPDPFSFPSGHAAAATAVATAVSWSFPSLAPLLLPLAVIVAVSRVSLRVHHPGDVVGGSLLGLAGVALAEALIS